jgi:hypothetical protein
MFHEENKVNNKFKTKYKGMRKGRGVIVMVFNATFSNISVMSWKSVLLVRETGVPGENHRPSTSN